ncbi:hypothetical protein AC249_AIPGENE21805 [Exaiptasia diaphana]|nr:hypothetical protein AC249_AIPGENE21805 [Exaiptasia diaphana]
MDTMPYEAYEPPYSGPEDLELLDNATLAPKESQLTKILTTSDKACQVVPEETIQKFQYEALQERRQRDIHNEVMNEISSLISSYTVSSAGAKDLLYDVINSKKFKYMYGDLHQDCAKGTIGDSKFLQSLAKDYQESKDRESSHLIRLQQGKFSEKILIGRTLKGGRFGSMDRIFKCSKATITSARVHAILFGKGGTPRDGLTFKRQTVNPEVDLVGKLKDGNVLDNPHGIAEESLAGGTCGVDSRDKGSSVVTVVSLLSCSKDISSHKASCGGFSGPEKSRSDFVPCW